MGGLLQPGSDGTCLGRSWRPFRVRKQRRDPPCPGRFKQRNNQPSQRRLRALAVRQHSQARRRRFREGRQREDPRARPRHRRLRIRRGLHSNNTAAIARMLVGAQIGFNAIPDRFVDRLELVDVILELADDVTTDCPMYDWGPAIPCGSTSTSTVTTPIGAGATRRPRRPRKTRPSRLTRPVPHNPQRSQKGSHASQ